jgi:hypothetical protein
MEAPVQRAEAVRQTCIAAALQASDEAGISGLGHEGCWDEAVEALRGLPLRLLVQALLLAVAPQDTTHPGVPGLRHHGHRTTEASARHHPVVRGSRERAR